ncbi:uncharacterized protein FA14DRAFT_155562 [Meira miltonrushii]|uniref:Uncharacterized protein n=1 Tax=Meira miltonrushii TaxID=1280837 RepID=A0A316VEV6_9BASI|nr:uncharacterized protein FA14DRAFT_155562 [Meira miltonrushii]PWN36159.1 hypothetical protein FA14DRAFT_155562 [Meira miltonrushii]
MSFQIARYIVFFSIILSSLAQPQPVNEKERIDLELRLGPPVTKLREQHTIESAQQATHSPQEDQTNNNLDANSSLNIINRSGAQGVAQANKPKVGRPRLEVQDEATDRRREQYRTGVQRHVQKLKLDPKAYAEYLKAKRQANAKNREKVLKNPTKLAHLREREKRNRLARKLNKSNAGKKTNNS